MSENENPEIILRITRNQYYGMKNGYEKSQDIILKKANEFFLRREMTTATMLLDLADEIEKRIKSLPKDFAVLYQERLYDDAH